MVPRNSFKVRLLPFLLLCLLYPTISSGKMLVGVIFTGNIPYLRSMHVAFLDELKKKLPAENDIKFVVQFPSPDPVAWSNAAKKLVVGGVDMIISYGYPATKAVLSKESDIPIVYVGVYDPESLNVGVDRMTGCGYSVPLSSLVRYYKQIMQVERLCVLYSSFEDDSVKQMNELARLAEDQKIGLLKLDFRSRSDLKALEEIGVGDAVLLTGSTYTHVLTKEILSTLREKNIPAADIFPDSSEDGVLITLYHDPEQQGRSAADIVAKMIAGEPAEKIEPVMLRNTELVINLIEAKKMGVSFPNELIGEATRVIE